MGGRFMVEKNRNTAPEWEVFDARSGKYTPIATGEIIISGPCIECGKETESVVRGDMNSVVFLCQPCGKAIREGRLA
jgi:hypothetical protein